MIRENKIFYEELDRINEMVAQEDMVIIMGDVNAQIGKEECFRHVNELTITEKDCVGTFATATNMCLACTKFTHKKIHKIT